MQQTKNYKFNKPEMSDTFSIEPLNENADRMETALDALAAADKKLDGRIATLEGRKFVMGTYMGNNESSQVIELGFKPIMVYVQEARVQRGGALAIQGQNSLADSQRPGLVILDNGFEVYCDYYLSMNSGMIYSYIAIG